MVMEAHLPGSEATAVPEAGGLATALREAIASGARAAREGRVPRWTGVAEAMTAVEARGGEGNAYDVLVRGAELVTESLDDLARAGAPARFGPRAG